MRTALTSKEVRELAICGGDGWLVLADLALEHGNEELAVSARCAFGGQLERSIQILRSLGTEGAITVSARASRRALEIERDAGRDPDKRLWEAVEAVESGARGERIDVCAAGSAFDHAERRAVDYVFHHGSIDAATASVRAARAAHYAARAAHYAARAAHYEDSRVPTAALHTYIENVYDASCRAAASAADAAANAAADAAATSIAPGSSEKSLRVRGYDSTVAAADAAARVSEAKELTLQLADIFEVWWESVCAQR